MNLSRSYTNHNSWMQKKWLLVHLLRQTDQNWIQIIQNMWKDKTEGLILDAFKLINLNVATVCTETQKKW